MWASLLMQFIPVLVPIVAPIVVEGAKKVVPGVPKVVLPVLSAVVGAASSVVLDVTAGQGVLLGAAGSAVYDLFKQVQKLFSDE